MFSIYTSGFNLIKNKFDYQGALENFAAFAEEVVIAINESSDGTENAVRDFIAAKGLKNVTVISTGFAYDDPFMDGKIKNAALQKTTNTFKIGVDLDERLPLWQRWMWENKCMPLLLQNEFDAFLIHSLDLWGNVRNVQNDQGALKKFKWYLHKPGLFRGAMKSAILSNGKVDTSKSDTCELIHENGDLAKAAHLTGQSNPPFKFLETTPFVYHLGYVNFQERDLRNKNFWQKHWETESGKAPTLLTTGQMSKVPVMPHNLKLWNE